MKWTFEACKEEALKYKTRKEFASNSSGSYDACKKHKWLNIVCEHMFNIQYESYWTKEQCFKEALKYNNYTDFLKGSNTACQMASRKGWMSSINKHFEVRGSKYKRFIYAYEFPDKHVYVGLTYNISERKLGHKKKGSVFNYCEDTKLEPMFRQIIFSPVGIEKAKELEQFHLEDYLSKGWSIINKVKTGGLGGNTIKWDYQSCSNEALKYETRGIFSKESASAYTSARKNKWLDDICKHMKKSKNE